MTDRDEHGHVRRVGGHDLLCGDVGDDALDLDLLVEVDDVLLAAPLPRLRGLTPTAGDVRDGEARGADAREHGIYSQETASGLAVAFLGLWILSFLVLGLVLAIDAAHRAVRTVDDGRFDPVRKRVPHTALELALAALLTVVSLGIDLASEPFDVLLAATATLGIWVLIHHTRTLGRFARRAVSRG